MNHLVVSNEINGACHTWTPIKNLCTHKIGTVVKFRHYESIGRLSR